MAYQADSPGMHHFRLANIDLDMSQDNIQRLHPKYIDTDSETNRVSVKKYIVAEGLPLRKNNYNTQGKKISINVNQFRIANWPAAPIAQFDIKVTPASGNEEDAKHIKEGVISKVWNAPAVKEYRTKFFDSKWIFDGKKIAWNKVPMKQGPNGRKEYTIQVDLDRLEGRPPRAVDPHINTFNITFRQTTEVKMAAIGGFLKQQTTFNNGVFEAINFLDHVLRQTPSERYVQVKRSFYTWDATLSKQEIINTMQLDQCLEFMRGVYASVRLCHMPHPNSTGLAVNLDVANGVFWSEVTIDRAALWWAKQNALAPFSSENIGVFAQSLRPVKRIFPPKYVKKADEPDYTFSPAFKELRRLVKLKVTLYHRGKNQERDTKQYSIKSFVLDKHHLNPQGANSKNTFFEWKNRAAGTKRVISVYDYMLERYNQAIKYWQLPLVQTARGGLFPMEYCRIVPQQRFPFKLNSEQTAKMIKFAVQRPKQRIEAINHGLRMLNWDGDEYLKHYGIKIERNPTLTEARILQPPEIVYNGKRINPGFSGRWNIQNVKFLKSNPEPLISWGICAIDNCVDVATMKNFITNFCQVYASHGGVISQRFPLIMQQNGKAIPDICREFHDQTGQQFKMRPQILMWVLPEANSELYARLKKNMDVRFGCVSQMMRSVHVKKASPQYASNVCMKFNAKLGGTTNMVGGKEKDGSYNFFSNPKYQRTMIVGADVSHPAPGSPIASMCSMTMSADKGCQRYWAACGTNGKGVEMITPANIQLCFLRLFPSWIERVGGGAGPQHIIYFRDGVSEGQYAQVINNEVAAMKAAILAKYGKVAGAIAFTVIVCGKRHKIRFFPKAGDSLASDKNGNPNPGTLVERDVTHPFENDFYLCSHSAIQGTARPTHYHIIKDEADMPVNHLHKMIYEHCYQYMRSTTPVSLYPAVYYAHLAAARARAHEKKSDDKVDNAEVDPRYGQKQEERQFEKNQHQIHVDLGIDINRAFHELKTEQQKIQSKLQGKQDNDDAVNQAPLPLDALGSGVHKEKNPDNGATAKKIAHSMWYI